jgi:transcription antitermination protein NusB
MSAATPRRAGPSRASAGRAVARKLALQGLYRWQLNPCPWQDLLEDFDAAEDAPKADRDYFRGLVEPVCTDIADLDARLTGWCDRPAAELDPIERAVLLIGVQELRAAFDVPFRVVISEAVSLTRRFGATDAHNFVNAVLDRAARELREHEVADAGR